MYNVDGNFSICFIRFNTPRQEHLRRRNNKQPVRWVLLSFPHTLDGHERYLFICCWDISRSYKYRFVRFHAMRMFYMVFVKNYERCGPPGYFSLHCMFLVIFWSLPYRKTLNYNLDLFSRTTSLSISCFYSFDVRSAYSLSFD